MRVDKCHHVRTNQAVARSPMASYRQALICTGKPEPSQIERRRHWDRAPSPFRRHWQPSRFQQWFPYRTTPSTQTVSIDTGQFGRLHWWIGPIGKQTSCAHLLCSTLARRIHSNQALVHFSELTDDDVTKPSRLWVGVTDLVASHPTEPIKSHSNEYTSV